MRIKKGINCLFASTFYIFSSNASYADDNFTVAENDVNTDAIFFIFSLPPFSGQCIGGCSNAKEIYNGLNNLTDYERRQLRKLGIDPDAPDARDRLEEFRKLQEKYG